VSASDRLIVVHIGSKNGFLEGAELIFKAGTASGDYHGQMNSQNFEKRLNKKVIPKLPLNSAVVMDNAPYHGRLEDKPPSKTAVKDMIDWLRRCGVAYDVSTRKANLFAAIEKLKPKDKIFKVDNLLHAHGHTALRTPPYM
jgi:hypothetical protein